MKPFKLKPGDRCPVHNSYFCCGRETPRKSYTFPSRKKEKPPSALKWTPVGPGIWRRPDPHNPRGFREKRNDPAMKALLAQKIIEQNNRCALCQEEFDDYRQIVAEHKSPKGYGGGRRDDHPDNIQAAHGYPCNFQKGSKRIA